jgi:hypothetical protein
MGGVVPLGGNILVVLGLSFGRNDLIVAQVRNGSCTLGQI